MISLVGRGMLVMDGHLIHRADHVTSGMAKHPIEHEVLEKFRHLGEAGPAFEAASVLKDSNLKSVLRPYRDKLERAGLMPDASVRRDRRMRLLLALMALGVVGVIKIQIGLSLERPVGFLVVMMIITMVIAAVFSFPRLTSLGKATLADVTNLYCRVENASPFNEPGQRDGGFGDDRRRLWDRGACGDPIRICGGIFRRNRSDSSGSSCGSSDSSSSCGSSGGSSDGGSSCGGGGCGGCGGS